jgi:hypothetical protein
LPASIPKLIDDPFRSLAGALKRAGGYAKDKQPFSEFRWADFLRSRMERTLPEREFDRALSHAMQLAASEEASRLPGWRGSIALPTHAAHVPVPPPSTWAPAKARLLS